MRTAEPDAGPVERTGALPEGAALEALAREFWAWTMRVCGGSREPDPLGGATIPLECYRWL